MANRPFDDKIMLDRSAGRLESSLWSDRSAGGMIATAHYRATGIGAAVLADGGNAVDAAVAAAFALGVCEPAGSGVGGMAMMLVHGADGKTVVLEGPCRAPRYATPEAVGTGSRKHGYRAVAVPTNVATLTMALERFGSKPAAELLGPSIALAEDGVLLTPLQSRLIADYADGLGRGNTGEMLLRADGTPPPPGARMRRDALAGTLRRLAAAGLRDFYTGDIGRAIARDMADNGGFVHEDDLVDIPWPRQSEPVVGTFGNWSVATLPPPGGGKALLQILHLLDELGASGLDPESRTGARTLAAAIRRARQDRRRYRHATPEDPDVASVSHAKVAAAELREQLDGTGETSHISVMDRDGMVVSLTQSIERSFGSKVMTRDLGFLYNGYMQGFKVQDRAHPHYLRPGAVARSNAVPTIVLDGGKPLAAIGSTGSERIPSALSQVLLRLRRGAAPFDAVAAPRLHCTPESEVLVEVDDVGPNLLEGLEADGFQPRPLDRWSFTMGGLQLVVRDADGFCGVSEPRRDGAAAGPA